MAAQKVNPFYIAANQNINDDDDDDLDRQDDNNVDLDDLLEDGDGVQSSRVPTVFSQPRRRPPSSSSSSSSGCSRSGLAFLIVLVLVIVLTRDWSGGSTANGLLPHNGNKDPKVVVLAERNTGGNWLVEQLGPCFPNLIVTESLQRAGYLFQDLTKYQDKTWVVVVVRDPYEWVLSMRDHPLHAPDHTALSLADFVTKKWTTENIKDEDTQLKGETGQVCQEYFTYKCRVWNGATRTRTPSTNSNATGARNRTTAFSICAPTKSPTFSTRSDRMWRTTLWSATRT